MRKRRSHERRESPEGSAVLREAKLFLNGRSQAVRLPADCRFEGDSVYAKKWRGTVILIPKGDPWQPLRESLGAFTPDFIADRDQPSEDRPSLDTVFDDDA